MREKEETDITAHLLGRIIPKHQFIIEENTSAGSASAVVKGTVGVIGVVGVRGVIDIA
jgi:hypothetical protein